MTYEELLTTLRAFLSPLAQRLSLGDAVGTGILVATALAALWILVQVGARFRRWGRPAPAAARGEDGGGPGSLQRDARRLARSGNAREAGHLFDMLGDLDRAAEQYERGRAFLEAAAVHERARRWGRAAALYERGGDLARAAECLLQAGDHRQAAALFGKAGRELRAAEALVQGQAYGEAAAIYEKGGSLEKAAALYERAGDFAAAGGALERHFLGRHGAGLGDRPAGSLPPEAAHLLQRCANLHRLARQPARAAGLLLQWGATEEAAGCFLEAGDHRRAMELYRAAGRLGAAQEISQLLGDQEQFDALRGEQLAREGKLREAAETWERAGEFERAGEAYGELKEWAKAGELLGRAGHHDAAGEMFEAAGLWAKAGAAYEASGRYPDAGRTYRQAGMPREAAAALARGGDLYGAATLLAEAGDAEGAIGLLQQLPADRLDLGPGGLLLARLLLAQDMPAPALVRLRAIARATQLVGTPVEAHYLLGRACEATGRWPEALEAYERVLAERVDCEDAAARAEAMRRRLAQASEEGETTRLLEAPAPAPPRYRIVGELSRGGMGIVYAAQDTVLLRPVALKVPAPAIQASPQARARFLQEARIAAGLRHPNIVTVYDAGEGEMGLYIAMELIQGTTLEAHLRGRGPLPPGEVLALARQICAGLAHAHAHGIVHADVKPANMLLDAAAAVHLTDFGLARAWEEGDAAEARGTPHYIAPEQARGEPLDARTDIYGLGCTLYRMLAGAPPFTTGDVVARHLHEPTPPLRPQAPGVPEALEAAILRCLAKRPPDRFLSAAHVLNALEAALPPGPPPPAGAPGAPPSPQLAAT